MVACLQAVLCDHALADDVARGDEVLADEGLAGVALARLGIVDVLGDDDEAGVARLLDRRVERVGHGDRRQHRVLLVGDRGLDQVGGAGGVAVGVDIGEVDLEQAGRFLGAELHRLEEGRARAAMLDEGDLDRLQLLRRARDGEGEQGGGGERRPAKRSENPFVVLVCCHFISSRWMHD